MRLKEELKITGKTVPKKVLLTLEKALGEVCPWEADQLSETPESCARSYVEAEIISAVEEFEGRRVTAQYLSHELSKAAYLVPASTYTLGAVKSGLEGAASSLMEI